MTPFQRLACLGLTFFAAMSAHADSSYQIRINYPDSEIKTFQLQDGTLTLPLRKDSKWGCAAQKRGTGFQVICFHKKSTVSASTNVPCIGTTPGIGNLVISDDDHKGYNFILTCNMP
jgi:hypothetical protein